MHVILRVLWTIWMLIFDSIQTDWERLCIVFFVGFSIFSGIKSLDFKWINDRVIYSFVLFAAAFVVFVVAATVIVCSSLMSLLLYYQYRFWPQMCCFKMHGDNLANTYTHTNYSSSSNRNHHKCRRNGSLFPRLIFIAVAVLTFNVLTALVVLLPSNIKSDVTFCTLPWRKTAAGAHIFTSPNGWSLSFCFV